MLLGYCLKVGWVDLLSFTILHIFDTANKIIPLQFEVDRGTVLDSNRDLALAAPDRAPPVTRGWMLLATLVMHMLPSDSAPPSVRTVTFM